MVCYLSIIIVSASHNFGSHALVVVTLLLVIRSVSDVLRAQSRFVKFL